MKWIAGCLVAVVLCAPVAAQEVEFWLTDDPAGARVDEMVIDRNLGEFEVYAMVDSGEMIMETIRMWAGFTPGIAEILSVERNWGELPVGELVLDNEAIFGADAIGIGGEFRLATLTLAPLTNGLADWSVSPLLVVPQGTEVVGEPRMRIVPEPEAALLLVMGAVVGLGLLRRRS